MPEKHGNQFPQFLSRLYHEHFNSRKDVLLALLLALCDDQEARSVVKLSLNDLFPYNYSSLFKEVIIHQPEKPPLSLAELGVPFLKCFKLPAGAGAYWVVVLFKVLLKITL